MAITSEQRAVYELDKQAVSQAAQSGQHYYLSVVWSDQQLRSDLWHAPAADRSVVQRHQQFHAAKNTLDKQRSYQQRELALNVFADIAQRTKITLKHARTGALGRDTVIAFTNQSFEDVQERLMATGYFERIDQVQKVKPTSNHPLRPVSVINPSIASSLGADPYRFDDTLYLNEWYLYEQQPWIMGAHSFIKAEEQLLQQQRLDRKVRIAVIDTGSFPHEDIVWSDEGADFVSMHFGSDLIGDCLTADETHLANDMVCAPEHYVPIERDLDPIDKSWTFPADSEGNPVGEGQLEIDGHGLRVTSVITAIRNNQKGKVSAIDNNLVDIIPIRAMTYRGGLETDVADAIVWAAGGEVPGMPPISQPVDIINLSLGSFSTVACTSDTFYGEAIEFARSKGVVVVAATGNDGKDVENFVPGTCDGVLTVGGNDGTGELTVFSNYGEEVDVTFTADDIKVSAISTSMYEDPAETQLCDLSGTPENAFGCYGGGMGTSYAAPFASAAVAMIKMVQPDWTELQLRNAVVQSAVRYARNEENTQTVRDMLQPQAGIGNAVRLLNTEPDLLIKPDIRVTHLYHSFEQDFESSYLAALSDSVGKSNVCNTVSISWQGLADELSGMQYQFWTSESSETQMTEETSTTLGSPYLSRVGDQLVTLQTGQRVAVQVILHGQQSQLYEVDFSKLEFPSFCKN